MTTLMSSGSPDFDDLRDRLMADAAVLRELEAAMRVCLGRVDPADRGSRFIMGGAFEHLISAAAWAVGVLTAPGGHNANGFDLVNLREKARGMWSVKSQTGTPGEWRITNGLGGAGGGMTDPTVFVAPTLPGLVLVDPATHPEVVAQTRQRSDAVVLPFGAVKAHAKAHPECVIPMNAPKNEHRGKEDAGIAFVESVATPEQFPRLSNMFMASKPKTEGPVLEIHALIALRDSGALTEEQFQAAVNKTIGL
ncbi:hypothetical protein [Demequina silvatica]|uniref:hypothetical protein n=1 Tax=Demequina silvatica TaxID=1638988 RepID=UPI0007847E97|nr:hypothetical protein [Demequina silvatica]